MVVYKFKMKGEKRERRKKANGQDTGNRKRKDIRIRSGPKKEAGRRMKEK